MTRSDTDNMLSVLDDYTLDSADDIALKLAEDFRHRRIEKNMTREQVAQAASVAVSNVIRFEPNSLLVLLQHNLAYGSVAHADDVQAMCPALTPVD